VTILSIDSSAVAASVALTREKHLLGEFYCNVGLTHSQTLMPMVQNLLLCAKVPVSAVDLFAVSALLRASALELPASKALHFLKTSLASVSLPWRSLRATLCTWKALSVQ
jgi:hypothetical protein